MTIRLTRARAKELGITIPLAPKKKGFTEETLAKMEAGQAKWNSHSGPRKKHDNKQGRDKMFDALCESHGLELPVHEYLFAKEIGRKWRFDYLWDGWLAVEKDGGAWVDGRHVHGQGFLDDLEKLNYACLLGYSILRFTPEQFTDGSAFAFIKRVLAAREEQP